MALLLAPAVGGAGPLNPNHRLESLRIPTASAVELLPLPGSNRILMFERSGTVRSIVGAEAAEDVVAVLPVATACAGHGILSATWDPSAVGSGAYVAYVASRNRALAVGRLEVGSGAFTELFNHGVAAPCDRVGGGLASGPDGMLYLGVGDFGQPTRAGVGTSNLGKIYRMTITGGVPMAPDEPNPFPGSYVYATGLRNPVALAADPSSDDIWFLDQGPGTEDEINLLIRLGVYGWNSSEQMGPLEIPGIEDPHYTWGPGTARDLAVDRAGGLGPSYVGTLLTAGSDGGWSIRPDRVNRLASTATRMVDAASASEELTAVTFLPDSHAYYAGASGVHRLLPTTGLVVEPSRRDSIVPLLATKTSTGAIEIAVERVPGQLELGLHVGLLDSLAAGYSHDDSPPRYRSVGTDPQDAWSRVILLPEELAGAGVNAYVLGSARRNCLESGLGRGSFGNRPIAISACTVDVLGGGTHDIADVEVTVIADATDRLLAPRDLAFHPDLPSELWVVNNTDSGSAVIIHDVGEPSQTATWHSGPGSDHFFPNPSALAFGPGTRFLATVQEEDDYTQGPPPGGTPQDFMGPAMWIADSAAFDGGHASHYDMLHNSPNGMGIAWETGNAYWIFDGYHGSLTRYDFVGDHGPGGSDHSDAIIRRHADGQLGHAPGIGSHVQHDAASGLVYACDTANNRIVVLDPSGSTDGSPISPNYDGCSQRFAVGSTLTTLIDGAAAGMVAPSGLELHDGMIFVSDNATSRILAFDMAGGLLDYLDTAFAPGTLMGMSFDPIDGSLWVTDSVMNRVLRIRPR